MRIRSHSVGALGPLLFLAAPQLVYSQASATATFGDVIQLPGGTPADIVLDEPRQLLYLISNSTSQVFILDYTTGVVTATSASARVPWPAPSRWTAISCT